MTECDAMRTTSYAYFCCMASNMAQFESKESGYFDKSLINHFSCNLLEKRTRSNPIYFYGGRVSIREVQQHISA